MGRKTKRTAEEENACDDYAFVQHKLPHKEGEICAKPIYIQIMAQSYANTLIQTLQLLKLIIKKLLNIIKVIGHLTVTSMCVS